MLKIKKPTQLTKQRPKVHCQRYLPVVESAVMMLYSVGGVGKSFAALREAIEYVLETGKKVALWLTEDPEGENRDRYERLLTQYASTPREYFDARIDFISDSPVKMTKLRDGNAILTDEFWQIRLELFDYSLVVLDPLLQFQGCDENSNTHAGVLMGALKDWSGEEQKTILLLHHASVNQGTLRLKPRGAGEWTNGTRGAYEISRVLNADGKTINESKKDYRNFTLTKDNGLSYYFRDMQTGLNERELAVFPPYEKRQEEVPGTRNTKVRMSVADHNDAKNPKGFEKVEVEFDTLHNIVREGRCYSPYIFEGGHRKNENNLGYSDILCLDFDEGMTLLQAEKKFKGLKCLFVTTRSHRKNGSCDRFRVIIKLKESLNIPADDHRMFMDILFDSFGSVDPATKDMARFFFASPNDAEYWYSKSDLEFDWRPFYEKVKKQKVFDSINKKRNATERKPKHISNGIKSNELPSDTLFTTRDGSTKSFSSFRDSLSYGGKEPVQCRHGIPHGDIPANQNLSAVIMKEDNGNVSYWCSGQRCSNEDKKIYCAED